MKRVALIVLVVIFIIKGKRLLIVKKLFIYNTNYALLVAYPACLISLRFQLTISIDDFNGVSGHVA